jgi:hypothetical protein
MAFVRRVRSALCRWMRRAAQTCPIPQQAAIGIRGHQAQALVFTESERPTKASPCEVVQIAEYERLRAMPAMHVAARRSSSSGRPGVNLLIMGRPRSRHFYRQAHTAHDQGLAEKVERGVAHEGRVLVLFGEPLVAAGQNLVVVPADQGLVLPSAHGAMLAPRTGGR